MGDVAGLIERMGGGDGELKFYIFPESFRQSVANEFERYRSYIYDLSRSEDKSVKLLSEATIRREIPVASISPAAVYNVPDDNKAYFTIQFGNESASGDGMIYEARILEESNPDGAIITIDGGAVARSFEIEAGTYINKTLAVQMGKEDVYDYEDLQIVFYSPVSMNWRCLPKSRSTRSHSQFILSLLYGCGHHDARVTCLLSTAKTRRWLMA